MPPVRIYGKSSFHVPGDFVVVVGLNVEFLPLAGPVAQLIGFLESLNTLGKSGCVDAGDSQGGVCQSKIGIQFYRPPQVRDGGLVLCLQVFVLSVFGR